jgi:lysophospholipase L1-like esterase
MRWLLLVSMGFAVPALAGDLVIAGYGDSLTGSDDSKWCGKVEAPNACDPTHAVSGERTRDGSNRLRADLEAGNVIDLATTHVTLAWGANDIRQIHIGDAAAWLSDFEQPLREAADAVRAAGMEPVLVVTLDQYVSSGPACVRDPVLDARLDGQIVPRIRDIADDYVPPLRTVDLNVAYDALSESTKCPGNYEAGFYSDHVHQTDSGYRFMRDVFIRDIAGSGPAELPLLLPGCLVLALGLSGSWSLRRWRRRGSRQRSADHPAAQSMWSSSRASGPVAAGSLN